MTKSHTNGFECDVCCDVKGAETDVIMSAVVAVSAAESKFGRRWQYETCLTDSNPFECWPAGALEKGIHSMYSISSLTK